MSENSPRGSKGGTGEEEEVTRRAECTQAAVGVHGEVVGGGGLWPQLPQKVVQPLRGGLGKSL